MDRKIKKNKWTWQRITVILVILVAVGFFTREFIRNSGTSRLNVDYERLLLDTVEHSYFQEIIPVTGVVLPIKTVLIGAIEGGRVEEKYVEDGAIVEAGQRILRLSNPDLQLNYLNQEANIVAQINQIRNTSLMMEQQSLRLRETAIDAAFRYDLVSKRLGRNEALYKEGVISEVEFQETKAEYESLISRTKLLKETIVKDSLSAVLQQQQMTSSLDLMKRNLDIAKQSLENLTIKAPIDGQLSGLTTELGELIVEGSQIAQIDDLEHFKVRVTIDEFYISRIYSGQLGNFTFAGDDYKLAIQKIFPQVTNGTFAADMHFEGSEAEGVRRGQTLSVKLELSAQVEALMVKKGSFYQSTGGNWVYVVNPGQNTATKRDIQIGRQNPNFYEVLSGLNVGDIVITSSYDNFGDKDVLVLQ